MGLTTLDVNLVGSPSFNMSFLDDKTALTGVASHDLSALNGLPTPGASGDVYAGGLESFNIIGQWEVVPRALRRPDDGCEPCDRRRNRSLQTDREPTA